MGAVVWAVPDGRADPREALAGLCRHVEGRQGERRRLAGDLAALRGLQYPDARVPPRRRRRRHGRGCATRTRPARCGRATDLALEAGQEPSEPVGIESGDEVVVGVAGEIEGGAEEVVVADEEVWGTRHTALRAALEVGTHRTLVGRYVGVEPDAVRSGDLRERGGLADVGAQLEQRGAQRHADGQPGGRVDAVRRGSQRVRRNRGAGPVARPEAGEAIDVELFAQGRRLRLDAVERETGPVDPFERPRPHDDVDRSIQLGDVRDDVFQTHVGERAGDLGEDLDGGRHDRPAQDSLMAAAGPHSDPMFTARCEVIAPHSAVVSGTRWTRTAVMEYDGSRAQSTGSGGGPSTWIPNWAHTSATWPGSISSGSGITASGGSTERRHEPLELRRGRDLEDLGCLGSDLERVRATPRQPDDCAGRVHAFGVAAREPDVAVDHVEEFVLDVVAVQRWPEVLRREELHDRHLTVGVLAGQLRGEEVVEEVEVFAFASGDQRGALKCHGVHGEPMRMPAPSRDRVEPTPQVGD